MTTGESDVADMPRRGRRRRWPRRLLVVAGIGAAIGFAAWSGLFERVSDEEWVRSTVESAGWFGPLLFVVMMIIFVSFNVPGLVFVVPATTLFGTVGGVLLSLLGGFGASTVGIVAARWFGRPLFESRMPSWLRRLETRVSARGFWAVVLLRSCTFLFQPTDWLCGLSSIRMRTVLVATAVGLIPPTLVVALSGGSLLDLLS